MPTWYLDDDDGQNDLKQNKTKNSRSVCCANSPGKSERNAIQWLRVAHFEPSLPPSLGGTTTTTTFKKTNQRKTRNVSCENYIYTEHNKRSRTKDSPANKSDEPARKRGSFLSMHVRSGRDFPPSSGGGRWLVIGGLFGRGVL